MTTRVLSNVIVWSFILKGGGKREMLMGTQAQTALRPASSNDVKAISDIYNYYVRESTATFAYSEESLEERRLWLEDHLRDALPVLIASVYGSVDGSIAGWGSLSRYNSRCGYSRTAEISVYLDPRFTGKGIGQLLVEALLLKASECGYHAIVAIAASENQPSIRMFKKLGFEEVGGLKEVGRKFDRWLDVTFMQKLV